MRAVEGNFGHPLQILGRGIERREKKYGLMIPFARATRGLRRPSLNARTMGKRQAALSNTGRGMKRR